MGPHYNIAEHKHCITIFVRIIDLNGAQMFEYEFRMRSVLHC